MHVLSQLIQGNFSSTFPLRAHQKVAMVSMSGTEIEHKAPNAVAPGDTTIIAPPGHVGGGG